MLVGHEIKGLGKDKAQEVWYAIAEDHGLHILAHVKVKTGVHNSQGQKLLC